MIAKIAADGDYGRPASPGWRGRDWAACERDALVARRRLHYLETGSGERAFVLVHGMGGRWQHWLETIPTLAEHGRVLALDLPGFGKSAPPAARVSLDGFADAAAELIRHLGVERVVLVGHSMGGPIALRFASRHPDLAEAIVLVGAAVFQFSALLGLRDVLRFIGARVRAPRSPPRSLAPGCPHPPPCAGASPARRGCAGPSSRPTSCDPAALASDSAALLVDGAGAPGVLPTARAIGRSDPREGIEAGECPILSIAGDRDRITPLPATEALQREVPRARTVVLEGCGHMAMLERPQVFNTRLLAFTDALQASSPTRP